VCLQETIKQSFTSKELSSLARGQDMTWEWIAPEGRSGGLLLGVNNDLLEVLEYKKGVHCQMLCIEDKRVRFCLVCDQCIWSCSDRSKARFS
jgi:hypothetical protein